LSIYFTLNINEYKGIWVKKRGKGRGERGEKSEERRVKSEE